MQQTPTYLLHQICSCFVLVVLCVRAWEVEDGELVARSGGLPHLLVGTTQPGNSVGKKKKESHTQEKRNT